MRNRHAILVFPALAGLLLGSCALLGGKSGGSARTRGTSVPGEFKRGVEILLQALGMPGDAPRERKADLCLEAAEALDASSGSDVPPDQSLVTRFLEGEAWFRAGRLEEAHDCFGELLKEDSDATRLEDALSPDGIGARVRGVRETVGLLLPGEERLGARIFRHVIQRETEIAFRFLAGEKRRLLGLKIQGGRGLAAEILEKTTELAPYGRWTAQSLFEIGNYYQSENELDKAILTYERLIREHPENRWRPPAEYYVARCFLKKNTDIDRDTVNLEHALMRFRIFLENNPRLPPWEIWPGEKVDFVANARKYVESIMELLARKKFRIAKGYLRKGSVAAARTYLAVILRNYPDTPSAREAKEILAENPDPDEAGK
jgi:outer membrane assembly lipoprotein YfiO